ncbi:hypothetical protein C8R44DRAFT_733954 [Mycena epipterygia]|nr:hypothetical protein C8R44DRAFT_733954 [Mycena epipterygia]
MSPWLCRVRFINSTWGSLACAKDCLMKRRGQPRRGQIADSENDATWRKEVARKLATCGFNVLELNCDSDSRRNSRMLSVVMQSANLRHVVQLRRFHLLQYLKQEGLNLGKAQKLMFLISSRYGEVESG